jgi:hypothetical protein
MDDKQEYLRPSKKDVDWALKVESMLLDEHKDSYMDWMNGRPMSARVSARDQRDGCIITGAFVRSNSIEDEKNPGEWISYYPVHI